MRNLILGVLFGVSLAFGIPALADTNLILTRYQTDTKPKITGDSGILEGIEVIDPQMARICHDPYYYAHLRVIACE